MQDKDLELVIEECAEVIQECAKVVQAATKILRFGIDDSHPEYYGGVLNSKVLTEEVGQLLHCLDRLDLSPEHLLAAAERKREKLRIYGPEGTYLAEKGIEEE